MTDRRPDGVPEGNLEAELRQLGAALAYPEADVAARVQARLAAEPTNRRAARGGLAPRARSTSPRWWSSRPWLWRVAVAALAVVLATGAVLVASPGARQAVADWLGLRGLEVRYRDPSGPPPPPLGSTLSLGERVDLAAARRGLSFPPLLPPGHLGTPDEFYLSPFPTGGRLTVVYRARDGLPTAGPGGEGLLLTQFRGGVADVAIRKVLGGGVRLEQVTVAGGPGYWFEGEPHQLFFADSDGQFHEDRSRLAGNTLVWVQGDLTLRLESALSRDASIRLAESLRR